MTKLTDANALATLSDTICRMESYTRKRLIDRTRSETYQSISRKTGLNSKWLEAFHRGHIHNPASWRIAVLYCYFHPEFKTYMPMPHEKWQAAKAD